MGNPAKLPNGLTMKQEAFKNKVLQQIADKKDVNLTQAAAEVYDVKNRDVARTIATENIGKPALKASIQEAMQRQGINSDLILAGIKKIAIKEAKQTSADVILRANVELLKIAGWYPTNQKGGGVQVNINQQINNVDFKQAKSRLQEVADESNKIINETDL